MSFTFTVTATLRRESGKFASRDQIADELREMISDADPGEISTGTDGDSVYVTDEWNVE